MLADVWPLLTAAEMRALDRHTIEALGVPGELLMECAAQAVAAEVHFAWRPGASVWVACGAGNNGGDGYAAARQLHLRGVPVRLWCAVPPSALSGDAAANQRRAEAVGVPVAGEGTEPAAGDVIVDALLGTGLSRPVEGALAEWVARIERAAEHCTVIAVDLPSGLDADTGQPLGPCVRADVTVTIGLPKLGLALEPGRSRAGRIVVARIGIADPAPGQPPRAGLWTRSAAAAHLPLRPAAGHKGTFGHVLVVAGSVGKTGAAALAAAGAARVGAGLVTIACPASANPILEVKCTEAMTAPLPETEAGALGRASEKGLLELAATRDVVVLGPGIGRSEETLAFVRGASGRLGTPLVLDADALLAFREAPGELKGRGPATIVTPHPGEAAALLSSSAAEVNRDRPAAARALAQQLGAVVVLKGAATVVAERSGQILVNPTGGPVLGSGGTGDVLAGVIGGFLAQGLDATAAAALAVYVHGAAADQLALRRGSAGVLASEVALEIPDVLRALSLLEAAPLGGGDALEFPQPG